MNKIYTALLVFSVFSGNLSAQNKPEALRDSLAQATHQLAFHPDSIDLRLKKVAWNIELKQWEYAKDDLDKVLYIDNKNIAGLFYRAYVNEKLNRFNFARLDYQNLLILVPGNFEAQLGLALLNEKDKHKTEAMDQINSLIEQYPDSAEAYAARGGIEKGRNMLDLAEFDYSKAIEKDPTITDYWVNRMELRILLYRKKDAMADYQELVKMGIHPGALKPFFDRIKKIK